MREQQNNFTTVQSRFTGEMRLIDQDGDLDFCNEKGRTIPRIYASFIVQYKHTGVCFLIIPSFLNDSF